MKLSTALIIYILFGLVLMPDMCMDSAVKGISLCLSVVVPSLFPFFICSKILIKNGFAEKISKPLHFLMRPLFNVPGCGAFAFVIGILSGCPVGAKTVTDIYEKSMCSHREAQRMLCFCNNSGPLFILGSVSAGMFGLKEIGGALYISHIISAIAVGFIMSRYKPRETLHRTSATSTKASKDVLAQSMTESVSLMGYVCGFIVFFSVVIAILRQSGIIDILTHRLFYGDIISATLYGMCEMTNGIANLSRLPVTAYVLCAVSFVIGFGGISVFLQVYGIVKKYNFSMAIFVTAKLIQGIISAFVTYLIMAYSKITLPVFAVNSNMGALNYWAFSIKIFAVFGIIILILSILYTVCKFLRRV